MYHNPNIPYKARRGNKLPPVVSQDTRETIDRESMLYSYQNSVESSYVGDIRHYVMKFEEYLKTKSRYFDIKKNAYVDFPVRYAAPNLAFSDDKGVNGAAQEASIKDRIVLPIISYYMVNMERDDKRAIDPCVRYFFKPDKNYPSRVWVTTAPRATNYHFQVDVWSETRESFYQLITAFQLDFNPYSYLTDIYGFEDETQKTFYIPYSRMLLTGFTDSSNFVPGTERRVVRGTLQITVEGFLTQPPKNMPYVFNTKFGINTETTAVNAKSSINPWVSSNNIVTSSLQEITGLAVGGGTVSSVFGRMGEVVSQAGDYNSEQVTLDQGVTGIAAPGDTLDTALTNLASVASSKSFAIRLTQDMPAGSVFKIINNQAYPVTSLDTILPSIDGITLEAGTAGSVITAGREINIEYIASDTTWPTDDVVYLSQTGGLTTTVPSEEVGDKYSIIVGKCLAFTKSIIFKPSDTLKLF